MLLCVLKGMFAMSTKTICAKFLGRSSYWVLHHFFKGGSSFPGKLANRIDSNVLADLAENYDVIMITGTNGKTLTTALTVKTLQEKYQNILTNSTGSNMMQGLTTAFLAHRPQKNQRQLAVLEVDEANMAPLCRLIKPKAIVLTNIFRDQLDRFGEIYNTYDKILDGIKLAPSATLIVNADVPIFSSVDLPNPKLYYGFNHLPQKDMLAPANTDGVVCPKCEQIIHYHFMTYGNQGDFFCPNCDFKRPNLDFSITDVTSLSPTHSSFEIQSQPFTIAIGGSYNIYNALAAYAVGQFFDVNTQQIKHAFESDKKIFGRQEVINVNQKDVTLVLVKNPVGLNQVLKMINTDTQDFSLGILLNANYADGIDTSWIWDGEFDNLSQNKMPYVFTGGHRQEDIYFRLKVADFSPEKLHQTSNIDDVIDKIKAAPTQHIYILATYTAMLELRQKLAEANYIKKGMSI